MSSEVMDTQSLFLPLTPFLSFLISLFLRLSLALVVEVDTALMWCASKILFITSKL